MSKLQDIQTRIDELSADLKLAEQTRNKANAALVLNPHDTSALQYARVIGAQVQALQGEIELLEQARESLAAEESGPEGEARRQAAAQALVRVREGVQPRLAAAEAIDRALVTLREAVAEWLKVNERLSVDVADFYQNLYAKDHASLFNFGMDAKNLEQAAANAITAEIDTALKGLNMSQHLAFNYLRQKAHRAERAVDAARSSNDTVMARMEDAALRGGVL